MSTLVSGEMIRLKGLAYTTIPMAKLSTKGNGKMIFRKAKVGRPGAMVQFLKVIM